MLIESHKCLTHARVYDAYFTFHHTAYEQSNHCAPVIADNKESNENSNPCAFVITDYAESNEKSN